MNRLVTLLSCLFGYMFLALSALVTTETIARKLFNFSFQGADELGGYALAVGSSLAFSIALIGRNHIRIDLLHQHFPRILQALLNWLSMMLLAAFGLLLSWVCLTIVQDTMEYKSTAPTPWATPLIYPQSLWYAGLLVFAVIAVGFAGRATVLFASGRIGELNREFHPKGAMEELEEEIEDLSLR
jgi:TRAP-type C4-dicarboxylate transport system permease small subunit